MNRTVFCGQVWADTSASAGAVQSADASIDRSTDIGWSNERGTAERKNSLKADGDAGDGSNLERDAVLVRFDRQRRHREKVMMISPARRRWPEAARGAT